MHLCPRWENVRICRQNLRAKHPEEIWTEIFCCSLGFSLPIVNCDIKISPGFPPTPKEWFCPGIRSMYFFDIGIEVSSKLPFLRLWGSYLGVLLGFEHHCSWKDIFRWTALQLEIFQLLSQAFMVIIALYYYGIIWIFINSCARHFCNWASYWNRTETTWLQNKYISQSCMYRTLQECIAIFFPWCQVLSELCKYIPFLWEMEAYRSHVKKNTFFHVTKKHFYF